MTERERNIGSDLAKAKAHRITKQEYDEAPVLTDDQLANAVVSTGARRGRPPIPNRKQPVKLRLDPDIVAGFRATGPGWQTRINDILGRVLKRTGAKRAGAPTKVIGTRKKSGVKPAAPRKRA